MAQKRENKDETLDLKVPTETLSISPRPDNFKMGGLDPGRIEPVNTEIRLRRSHKLRPQIQDPASSGSEHTVSGDKKAVSRCCGCGKRVRLTGFRCRCGDLFCSEHRYSDRHDCSFDYKAAGREAIARENPLVRAAKILKV